MKSNHSFIRILLFALFVLVLLCLCFAQNKNRIKKTRRFEESEIYQDIVRAEDDEFVDDIPIDENEFKDDDQDVEYENCIEYQGGHKETYTPRHRGDKSSQSDDSKDDTQKNEQISFNPYSYYKSLLDQDLNYVKFYGDKVNTHGTDSQYSQIAKKYANNLANHAKYLYKYRTFAPTTYRKYILQVYEYSKRVVEVAKVQNWNGYMYYLSITIEYYRKIDVLEQTGYAGTNYVQTTPVATYYGASNTPNAYYSNGAPPAGAVTATAVAPVNPSYYPANYGGGYGGYGGGYPVNNYYPSNYGYGNYGYPYHNNYPVANYYGGYPAAPYYPTQYRQPVQTAVVAKANNQQQPIQASTSSQASSNTNGTTTASSSSSASSAPTSSNSDNNSTASGSSNSSSLNNSKPQKKKLNPIEQLELLNSQVSSHVGEFNDDASNPKTEPFTFEYLM